MQNLTQYFKTCDKLNILNVVFSFRILIYPQTFSSLKMLRMYMVLWMPSGNPQYITSTLHNWDSYMLESLISIPYHHSNFFLSFKRGHDLLKCPNETKSSTCIKEKLGNGHPMKDIFWHSCSLYLISHYHPQHLRGRRLISNFHNLYWNK